MTTSTIFAGTSSKQRTLRANPIQRFMWMEDRPQSPMTMHFLLELDGQVQRGALQDALTEAMSRHWLAQSLLEVGNDDADLVFRHRPDLPARIDFGALGEPIRRPGGDYIDLRREIGLCLWVREDGARVELTLLIHHAALDGISAMYLICDMLTIYGRIVSGDSESYDLHPLHEDLLQSQHACMTGSTLSEDDWRKIASDILGGRNEPLCAAADGAPIGASLPDTVSSFVHRQLDQEVVRRLRQRASRSGGTLNGAVLAAAFGACRNWNERFRVWRPQQKVTIMMPMALDVDRRQDLPGSNLTTYAWIRRRADEIGAQDELLRSICEQLPGIPQRRTSDPFLLLTAADRSQINFLDGMVRLERCLATVVVTNVGKILARFTARFPRHHGRAVFGNLILRQQCGSTPLRPLTRANFAFGEYDRQLTCCVRCDHRHFSPTSQEAFAQLLIDQLMELAEI